MTQPTRHFSEGQRKRDYKELVPEESVEIKKGELSKLTKLALESKKREVIKDWLKEGRLKR